MGHPPTPWWGMRLIRLVLHTRADQGGAVRCLRGLWRSQGWPGAHLSDLGKEARNAAFVRDGQLSDSPMVFLLQDKFTKSVSAVVKAGDVVRVKVMAVDAGTGRIGLSMKGVKGARGRSRLHYAMNF